jgi:YaiO family outer membrane protein
MNPQFAPLRCPPRAALLLVGLVLLAGNAIGQNDTLQKDLMPGDRLPSVVPAAEPSRKIGHALEFGGSLGRYTFDGSDETSAFDSQFARYSRSRPAIDRWRFELGRQGRFAESSLDLGASYTRYLGATSLTAGLSGGTNKLISNKYRFDLGVSRPLAGFVATAGYLRAQSHGDNRADSGSLGLTRWLSHWILGAGYRLDFGHPGDTRSSTYSLGATYYVWRQTYLGAGVSWGGVSYQLVGPGAPLPSTVLVDYDSWNASLALTQYLTDVSGLNLRFDHSRAQDIWWINGLTLSYFREW